MCNLLIWFELTASDDESSDKEDVPPDVESSQGESDTSGDLNSGNNTQNDSESSEGKTS
jgi:hypothetical protein